MADFTPEPPPTSAGRPELVAWLDRLNQNLDNYLREVQRIQDALVRVAILNGIEAFWLWDDATAGAVADGFIASDAILIGDAAELRIAYADFAGRNFERVILALRVGDIVELENTERGALDFFSVVTEPVDLATFATVEVLFLAGRNINSQANDVIETTFLFQAPDLTAAIRRLPELLTPRENA